MTTSPILEDRLTASPAQARNSEVLLLETGVMQNMLIRFLTTARHTLARLIGSDKTAAESLKEQRKQTDQRLARNARQAEESGRK